MAGDWWVVGLVVVVTLLALWLPVLRTSSALVALIVLRSLVDIGASSGAPLLPITPVNGAIAAALLLLVLFSGGRKLPHQLIPLVAVPTAFILFGTMIGLMRFGTSSGAIEEGLRLLSVVAVLVTAARLGSARPRLSLVLYAGLPATVLLIVGALISFPLVLQTGGRVAGTFGHANAAASFMSVVGLVGFAFWFFQRSRAALLTGVAGTFALFLTQSIGGLAGFVAGAFVVMIVNTRIPLAARLGSVVAATLVTGGITVFSQVGERLLTIGSAPPQTNPGGGSSLGWRFTNWELLLQDWKEAPWFGYGLGSTSSVLMPLGAPPHSLPVQILVEGGILGAVVALVVVLAVSNQLFRLAVRGRWEASVLLGLVVLVLVNGSESNLIGYTASVYLIVFTGGLLAARCCLPAAADHGIASGAGSGAQRLQLT